MNLSNEILFFFSALGAFNCLILSCYFFFFSKTKSLANVFLGLLLLALSIRIGKSVMYYFNPNLDKIYLQIGLSACYFIGPFLYYFVKSSLNQVKKTPLTWKLDLVLQLLIIVGIGCYFPYNKFVHFWRFYFIYFIYAQWLAYIIFSGWAMKPIFINYFQTQEPLKTLEKWVLLIFLATFLILIAYILAIFNVFKGAYISGAILFSFLMYVNVFTYLFRNKTGDLFGQETVKYQNKKIETAAAFLLTERLYEVSNTKEIYTNQSLKVNDLARKMNISAHQLSQLLNDNLGKNFPNFINEIRIEKACELMKTDDRLKLEAVAYEVGFNSKSTFFAAFKKIKGTSPLLFKENIG